MKHTTVNQYHEPEKPLAYKVLAHLMSLLLIINPVLIQAQPVINNSNGGNASQGESANNTPVINISTPSAAGVSHNTYDSFNVTEQNLILNNSASVVQSQLGGTVNANSNLTTGQEARFILNEVTQPNRSQLNGYTEIAGQQAELIIANPYGITCNGCGFINTPDVTLTTGTPQLQNGQLQNYSVDQGDILIEGLGLNATNVDHFSIITRATQINAQVNANDLDIVLGRNDVNPNTLTPTAKTDDGSAKPQFALDSSAVGGMYANSITLVGTESGVGVKVAGDMATDIGNLSLSADGNITLNRTQSANDLNITSSNGDVELNNTTYAVNDLNINASTVSNNNLTAAQNNLTINADNLNQNSTLVAGLNTDYTINNTGSLDVNITNTLNNDGLTIAGNTLSLNTATLNNNDTVQSGGNTQITATTVNNNQNITANDITINADNLNNNTATSVIKADNNSNLQIINTLDNSNGVIDAANTFTINANNIDNISGTIESAGAGATSITATTSLNNTQGEIRTNSNNFTLNTNTLTNQQGQIAHAGTAVSSVFNLHIDTLDNRAGFMGTNGQLNLSGFTAIDNSLLAGNSTISTIIADHLEINSSTASINNAGGRLYATGTNSANINIDTINNDGGDIFSVGNLSLNTQSLSNSAGLLQSSGNIILDLLAWDVNDINSVINASNHLTINLQGDLTHNAGNTLIANNDLTINATGNIFNSGEISTGNDFTFTGNNLTNNTGAILSAGNNLTLTIQDLINNSGRISAQNTLAITAGTLTNSALIGAGDALHITTLLGDITNNGGVLFSNNMMNLNTDQSIHNLLGSSIFAVGDMTIAGNTNTRATEILNESATIETYNGDMFLRATTINNRRTTVSIDPETGLNTSVSTAAAQILAGDSNSTDGNNTGNLTLDANTVNNTLSVIGADGDIDLQVTTLNNQGATYGSQFTDTHIQSITGVTNNEFYGVTNNSTPDNFDISNGAQFISYIQNQINTGRYQSEVYMSYFNSFVDNPPGTGTLCEFGCLISRVNLYRITANSVSVSKENIVDLRPLAFVDLQQLAVLPSYGFPLGDAQRNTLITSGFTVVNPNTLTSTSSSSSGDGYTFLDQNTIRNPQVEASSVIAGGTLTGNLASLNNTNGGDNQSGQNNAADVDIESRDTSARRENITAPNANSIIIEEHTFNPANNITLPNNGGLFSVNTDPGQNYLIETNPDLIDLGFFDPDDPNQNFTGTDDIFALLPENPEVTTQRLGDAYYETRLIREAVFNTTGQRYVDESITNDIEQMQYLVNNAIAVREDLQLTVGVSLSDDQIAQLTHDIIWLEEQDVQGHTVLVPVYYASALRAGDMHNGALIMADNIDLNVNDNGVVNMGRISARQNLHIESAQNILNRGNIQAGNNLSLSAGTGLDNIRGRISTSNNGQLLLVARTGNINNAEGTIDAADQLELKANNNIIIGNLQSQGNTTLVTEQGSLLSDTIDQEKQGTKNRQPLATRNTSTAQSNINIQGNLTTDIKNNIQLTNTNFNVSGDTNLQSEGSIHISGSIEESVFVRGGYRRENTHVQQAALHVGGNLTLDSNQTITLTATDINTDGNLTIKGESIALNALQERTYTENKQRRSHVINSITENITSDINAANITLITTGITDAEGNYQSGGDLTTEGSQFQTTGDMIASIQGNTHFNAVADENYHYSQQTKKRWYGKKTTTQTDHVVTANTTDLTIGGNLITNIDINDAGELVGTGNGNVTFEGSELNIGGQAVVYGQEGVNVLSAIEYEVHEKKKNRSVAGGLYRSSSTRATDEQRLGHAELNADGNIALLSEKDINVVASDISGQNIVAEAGFGLSDAEKQNSQANVNIIGENQVLSSFEESSRGGITFKIDDDFLALAEETRNREWQTDTTYIGSSLNATENIRLEAANDINAIGSSFTAGDTIAITADRDINIIPGVSTTHNKTETETTRIGLGWDSGGGSAELFAGAETSRQGQEHTTTTQGGQTNQGDSQNTLSGNQLLASNIHINAGRDTTILGSDLITYTQTDPESAANGDVQGCTNAAGAGCAGAANITIDAGRDINTNASINSDDLKDYQESLRVGARIGVTDHVRSTETALNNAEGDSGWANDVRALDSVTSLQNGLVSAEAGFIAEYSRDEQHQTSQTSRNTHILSHNITLNSGRHQNHIGTQALADNNLTINAEGNLLLQSSQDTTTQSQSSQSASANIGISSNSAAGGIDIGGSLANSVFDSTSTTHNNARFIAGNTATINVAGDATLEGAVISGADVYSDIQGNLTVTSVQDTSRTRGESQNLSASTSGSVSIGGGNTTGDSAWVNEQSGILAQDRLEINVDGHTQVNGGIINSETGNLNIITDTIAYTDIQDYDRYDSQNLNLGFNVSPGDAASGNTQGAQQNSGSISTNSVDAQRETHNRQQITRATIGEGTITVRQDAQTGEDTTQQLNRDTNLAQEVTRDDSDSDDFYVSSSAVNTVQTVATQSPTDTLNNIRNGITDSVNYTRVQLNAVGGALADGAIIDDFNYILSQGEDNTQRGGLVGSQRDSRIVYDTSIAFAQTPEGQILQNAENHSVEDVQRAEQAYVNALSEDLGITDIAQLNIILGETVNVNADSPNPNAYGAYDNANNQIYINHGEDAVAIDDSGEIGNVIAHETGHSVGIEGEGYASSLGLAGELGLSRDDTSGSNDAGRAAWVDNAQTDTNIQQNNTQYANTNPDNLDYLLPEAVRDAREAADNFMDESREASQALQGDPIGTVLSVAAMGGDIAHGLADLMLSGVDITTDMLAATGLLGADAQIAAFENISDRGEAVDALIENREAIGAALLENIQQYPERIAQMDPAALRQLAGVVGEAALPVAAVSRLNRADNIDLPDGQAVDRVDVDIPSRNIGENQFDDDPLRFDTDAEASVGSIEHPTLSAPTIDTNIVSGATVRDFRTGEVYEGSVNVRSTLDRIESGESYPHRNDGAEFRNLPNRQTGERGLPDKPPGYYTEYVVPSDQMNHVGPQRIVVGRDGEAYYTPDHYETFIKIRSENQ